MTPPINSEISKKLRAAIRAKLEELGVYVDDELPDYIMVMIANKKEKKQMKDDLTLFLSKNTDAFVEWLFDICHRLQSAPAAAAEAKPAAAKEVKKEKKKYEGFSVKKEEKAKKKVASDVEKEKERERERKEKKEAERREIERANREDRERRDREEREKREREERREKEKEERERREREERDRKERERERKEREQRDREREEERQREKRREREREQRETPPTKHRHSPIRTRRALSPDVPVPSAAVRRRGEERASEERKEPISSSITRADSPPPPSVQSKVVVKRQVRSQNDSKGAKGASSMFLRAMNAASVSAGYGGGPVSRKRAAPTAELPQFSDEEELANGEVEEEKEEVPRKKAVPTKRVVQPPIEKKEPRFIVTFNKKEGEEDGKRSAVKRGARDENEEEEDGAVRVSSAPRKTASVPGEKRRREGSTTKENEQEETRKRMSISVSPPQKHCSPSDWDGHIHLNDDETSDEEAAIDAMLAATRVSRVQSRGETERLPPTSHLSRGNSYYEPYDPAQPAVSAVHIATQAYVPTPLSHSMIRLTNPNKIQERCKFFPNCKEGDECIYFHPSRPCTNFPRCSFGSRCMYTHPKCKFDAACNNSACPFTHTVHKKAIAVVAPRQTTVAAVSAVVPVAVETTAAAVMEEKKTKIEPDVPLVPAPPLSRTRVPSTLMSTIPCRFAAGCTNPSCAYKHPTECRFGQNCRNSYCYFYHPPASRVSAVPAAPAAVVASPNKLKWKAPAATPVVTKTESV
ncbi:hypothetical protein PMAYCL1PPCAC_29735 [Pristionchus mayeri]|uniref:Zinc finger CCCH domain-containing protein 14 n=1 Tax=Pristionchus mayeri TaxID=1317129 RepID=A0AAN5DBH5_9BILA|nr:hypothetical protein PMAYCL1PPCAC_29735 [Pristionchus mayeri]